MEKWSICARIPSRLYIHKYVRIHLHLLNLPSLSIDRSHPMALSNLQSVAVILLLLLPIAARGDDGVPPSRSPFFDNLCKEVECGRGSCEGAPGSPFNFKCDCQDGWKRTRLDDEDNLEFLPCIIPNCTVDYSCMPAAPPMPAAPVPINSSAFDPCYWTYCGEGTCTKNGTRGHTCQCRPGYSNLLNISVFPCYNDCATGSDSCRRLISANATSDSDGDQSNAATAFSVGKVNGMAVLVAAVAFLI